MWDAQYDAVIVPANGLADQEIREFKAKLGTLFSQGSSADGHAADLANATIQAMDAVFKKMQAMVSRGFTDYSGAPGSATAVVIKASLANDIGQKLDAVVGVANNANPGHIAGKLEQAVHAHLRELKQQSARLAEALCGG
jgi:hypothetical protein